MTKASRPRARAYGHAINPPKAPSGRRPAVAAAKKSRASVFHTSPQLIIRSICWRSHSPTHANPIEAAAWSRGATGDGTPVQRHRVSRPQCLVLAAVRAQTTASYKAIRPEAQWPTIWPSPNTARHDPIGTVPGPVRPDSWAVPWHGGPARSNEEERKKV